MESFGHKMIIWSQPVPLTGTGVLYPCVRDFSPWFFCQIALGYISSFSVVTFLYLHISPSACSHFLPQLVGIYRVFNSEWYKVNVHFSANIELQMFKSEGKVLLYIDIWVFWYKYINLVSEKKAIAMVCLSFK